MRRQHGLSVGGRRYPLSGAPPLALLAAALGVAAVALGIRRGRLRWRGLGLGGGAVVGLAVLGAAAVGGLWALALRLHGWEGGAWPVWPAVHPPGSEWHLPGFGLLALALGVGAYRQLRRRHPAPELALAGLAPFLALAPLLAAAPPGASYVASWPGRVGGPAWLWAFAAPTPAGVRVVAAAAGRGGSPAAGAAGAGVELHRDRSGRVARAGGGVGAAARRRPAGARRRAGHRRPPCPGRGRRLAGDADPRRRLLPGEELTVTVPADAIPAPLVHRATPVGAGADNIGRDGERSVAPPADARGRPGRIPGWFFRAPARVMKVGNSPVSSA
jgi:hypothetical protein